MSHEEKQDWDFDEHSIIAEAGSKNLSVIVFLPVGNVHIFFFPVIWYTAHCFISSPLLLAKSNCFIMYLGSSLILLHVMLWETDFCGLCRQRRGDDKWKHDLYEDARGPQVSSIILVGNNSFDKMSLSFIY